MSTRKVQMLMALVHFVPQRVNARLFFDSGSSRSYITTALAQKLDLVISGDEVIYSTKFGDRRRRAEIFHNAIVDIPINTGGSVPVSALVTDNICCPIQKYPLNVSSNPILEVIPLADNLVQETQAVPIDILVGQNYIHEFIGTERLALDNEMYLIASKFGYILTGKIPEGDFHSNTESLLTVSLLRATAPECPISLENFWSIEDIGIKDNPYSTDDEAALEIFNRKIRFVDGRYEVGWLWKDQNPELPDNFGLAFGRLKSLVYRFAKQPEILEEYNVYLQDQLSRGIIEEVDGKDSETNIIHCIPHHPVIKKDRATTKLRIVYNASVKCNKNAPSINECLHRGPVILQDLCGIIIRFREHSIAISCDIENAFLQVSLRVPDRDVSRFLWLNDASKPVSKDNLLIYRFQRVPFGFISSPFLLEATIQHHLNHQKSFVAKDIVRNIYVDNIITGTNTVEEAQAYFHNTKTVFDGISMNVREWFTNSSKFRNTIKPKDIGKGSLAKILGLQWNTDTDTLSCPGFLDFTSSGFTKRSVLKSISSIFDPCGFFTPVVIKGKMILQHIWQDKPLWDDPLPEKTSSEYEHIRKDLESISGCVLQRQIHSVNPDMVHNYELHCFCDASAKAYAAVIYLRCITKDNRVPTSIVFSKTRIKEIKQHNQFQFRYVPTTVNPADLPSRGLSIADLQNSNLWWNGPNFLVLEESKWPENEFSSGNLQTEIEKQDVTLTVLSYCSVGIGTIIDINRYSSLNKVLRISAWCRRFIHNCKKSSPKKYSIVLSASERGHALHLWIQNVQASFEIENQSAFKHLGVYSDDNGIYRCKGRLQYSDLPKESKFPILLPKDHCFTKLIIQSCHEKQFHAGYRQTVAQVREEYWIPHGVSQVQKVLRKCLICRKVEGGPFKSPLIPPLPWFRITRSLPFANIGIDYLGPLYIRHSGQENRSEPSPVGSTKVWICLITCAVTRAVHLEIVLDNTVEQFLMAFRRFVAYFDAPNIVVSDNAKTFIAAEKAIRSVFKSEKVQEFSASEGIEWKFITALSPWMGGFYERMVGSVKRSLRKVLGSKCLTLVQLQTVIAEISAIVNSRPLIPANADVGEMVLTPADFLGRYGKRGLPRLVQDTDFFIPDSEDKANVLSSSWLKGQKILDEFWWSWQREYLPILRDRSTQERSRRNISPIGVKVDCMVLIKENTPRVFWRVGRIVEVYPGKDGLVRSALVKLSNGQKISRPVVLLYPIEEGEYNTSGTGSVIQANTSSVQQKPHTRRQAAKIAEEKIKMQLNSMQNNDD